MDEAQPEEVRNGGDRHRLNRTVKKLVFWTAPLYVVLALFPIENRVTRALIVLGAFGLWGGALFVWWSRRWVRITLLTLFGLGVVLVALPGRTPDPQGLRSDNLKALALYEHTHYIWGGENLIGIDCSGLVREGFVWGELLNGVRTLNGTPIRNALSLWWNDSSAGALRDGYMGQTVPVEQFDSVNAIPFGAAAVGDMAVTTDGLHVMVFLGGTTWMEADASSGRVVKETVPADSGWFKTPVALVRWSPLAG